MKVTRLEAWLVRLRLSEPYTVAYATVDSAPNVFVRLHTDGPLVGHGCAAPDPAVTGETAEGVLAALQGAGSVMVGLDPTHPALVYRRLQEALGFQPAALAAVDVAVYDLLARVENVPLWKLLGGARERIRTSMTIGILGERETVEQARRWVREGFTSLKLKGGLEVAGDVARVRKVREAVGPCVELSFDANQGYTVADSLAFVRGCAGVGLAYLEQPTPRERPEWLAEVQRQPSVAVMADESLVTVGEARALAEARAVRLFNIKLQKVGGIRPALTVGGIAEGAGVGVMVGCYDEAALGIAAGLHFALARPDVWYADLDAHFALVDDPSAGAVCCRGGYLHGGAEPGLGFRLG